MECGYYGILWGLVIIEENMQETSLYVFLAKILLSCSIAQCWKRPSRCVLRERCSENMQQIYRRTPMLKCDFDEVTWQISWNHTSAWVFYCKFAAYFRTPFPRNTSGWLLLQCTRFCARLKKIENCPENLILHLCFLCAGRVKASKHYF